MRKLFQLNILFFYPLIIDINSSIIIVYFFASFLFIILCLFITITAFVINSNLSISKKYNDNFLELRINLFNKFKGIETLIREQTNIESNFNNSIENFHYFNETIKKIININSNYFCHNQNVFNNSIIEKNIKISKAYLNNITFNMYIYKEQDIISNSISTIGNWELSETNNLISSLNYYSEKMKTNKNDIYILDIGANIGWYSLYLGKNGFKVFSFEPSKINYYILLKNYCLNNDIDITIINKGIDIEDNNLTLYHPLSNIGDAFAIDNSQNLNKSEYFIEDIELSELNVYLPYFENKHLALLKLDVEGSEEKVIKSGIDLIVKYHIPFILMELNIKYLTLKGTNPKIFLEMFENNGYKISTIDFLSKKYSTIEKILKKVKDIINLYIIYTNFLE